MTNGGNVYQCTAAGESAGSGGPSGTAASISDGSVTWKYLGAAANSGITITDPTQATFVGQFTLRLAKADTASLVAGDYVYDLWASLASGLEWPLSPRRVSPSSPLSAARPDPKRENHHASKCTETGLSIPVLPIKPPSDAAGVYGRRRHGQLQRRDQLAKMAIKLSITGGTSTTLFMYGMDANDQSFGLISDVGNLGQLGGITIPTGDEYLFVVRDIGWLAEVALVEKSAVGATASLSCGTVSTNWNTVVQAVTAGGSGNQVQVVLSPTGTTKARTLTELNDSLVCASIFAYLPGV